jgi:hypothetical protein
MRLTKALILLFFLLINQCIAQQVKPADLFGKWKVKNALSFGIIKSETYSERSERIKLRKQCLAASAIINGHGIQLITKTGSNICIDNPCNCDLTKPNFIIKKIVKDNSLTENGDGQEMIDSNIVGKKFVRSIDHYYTKSTLTLINTNCQEGYGNFTMKICIINKKKLVYILVPVCTF